MKTREKARKAPEKRKPTGKAPPCWRPMMTDPPRGVTRCGSPSVVVIDGEPLCKMHTPHLAEWFAGYREALDDLDAATNAFDAEVGEAVWPDELRRDLPGGATRALVAELRRRTPEAAS